jgi:hypothetical protein
MKKIVMLTLLVLLSTTFASAQTNPREFNFSGQLLDATGTTPNLGASVVFTLSIRSVDTDCVLYREVQTLNLSTSNGYFSIGVGSEVGAPKRAIGDPGHPMTTVYRNTGSITGNSCTYNPAFGDQRELVVNVDDGIMNETLSAQLIKSVPTAFVAENAESVGGIPGSSLLQINNGGGYVLNQSNLENVFTAGNYSTLTSLLGGSSPLYNRPASNGTNVLPNVSAPSSPSAGQIWYNIGNIYYHDGTATRTISTSTGPLVETDIPTLTTAGKVSGTAITSGNISTSGNFTTTGTITATAAITSSGALSGASVSSRSVNIFDSDDTNRILIQTPPTAALSANYTLTLPTNDGAANQVLQTDGSGMLTWVTPAAGGITALTGEVTATGPGSATATIANSAVTFAKMQNINNLTILGRSSAGTGVIESLTMGTGLSISGGIINVGSLNTSALTLGTLPIARGGTNSSTALNNNRIMVSSGGAIVEAPALTNGQILIGSTGAAPVAAVLTAGTNITIAPSAGGITINATAGGTGDFLANGTVPMAAAFRSIAGTAAAPGLTFVGDTDNGIYAPTADSVAVTTAGTEKLRVNNSGVISLLGTTQTITGTGPMNLSVTGSSSNLQLNTNNGNIIANTGTGKIALGVSASNGFSSTGVCAGTPVTTIPSTNWGNIPCTGAPAVIPSPQDMIVTCSHYQTSPFVGISCRGSTTAGQVQCRASGDDINSGTRFVCQWTKL